jgi:hypothetical protein
MGTTDVASEQSARLIENVQETWDRRGSSLDSDYCGYFHGGYRKMLSQRLLALVWLTPAVKTRSNHYERRVVSVVSCVSLCVHIGHLRGDTGEHVFGDVIDVLY